MTEKYTLKDRLRISFKYSLSLSFLWKIYRIGLKDLKELVFSLFECAIYTLILLVGVTLVIIKLVFLPVLVFFLEPLFVSLDPRRTSEEHQKFWKRLDK